MEARGLPLIGFGTRIAIAEAIRIPPSLFPI
jgi:hypothetical protein